MMKAGDLLAATSRALVHLKSSLSQLMRSLFASMQRWRAHAKPPTPYQQLLGEIMATLADLQTAAANQSTQLDLVVAKVAQLKTVTPLDQAAVDAVAATLSANDTKIAAALA
jgi:hypothetical protein